MNEPSLLSEIPLLRPLTIERPHLLEILRSATQHRLTLLAAPPGYGKTTLIAALARELGAAALWHTVEKREHNLPSLVEHSLSVLSAAAPRIQDVAFPPAAPPEELAELMTDSLRRELRHDVLYILDDVHFLINAPEAEIWLRAFIDNLPSACHLMLVGRALPTLPIAELIARREVLAIGHEQLRFTFEEAVALAKESDKSISNAEVQALVTRLDGWPAGVLLALQPLPLDVNQMVFDEPAGPEGLFDAMADLLLRSQVPGMQDFLLHSSTLTKLSPSLCQSALGLSDSLRYFNDVTERQLFVTRVSGGLTYHPLFRSFLQRRLQARDRAQFVALHHQAACWFETNSRFDDAFDHLMAAERVQEAGELAGRSVQMYFAQGQTETVLEWQAALTQAGVSVARLSFYAAMIYRSRAEYEQVTTALDEAEAGYRSGDNQTGLVQVALARATVENHLGHFQAAIEQASPCIEQLSLPPGLRGFAMAICAHGHFYLGELALAAQELETALPLYRGTGDQFAIADLLVTLEQVYVRLGRFDEAARLIDEFVALRRAFGSSVGIAMALNNLGYFQYLCGDYLLARRTLEEGLLSVRRMPEIIAEGYLRSSLGDLERDLGNSDEALRHYRRGLELTQDKEPSLRCALLVGLATLHRWSQQFTEARACLDEALELANSAHLLEERLESELALCALLLDNGQATLSRRRLPALLAEIERYPFHIIRMTALGICAYRAALESDEAAAQQYLDQAAREANHRAGLRSIAVEASHNLWLRRMIEACPARFAALADALRQMDALNNKVTARPPQLQSVPQTATYSLVVQCFGAEQVERDGVPVASSAWKALAARTLFFYLLFKGAVTREQIGLDFWPDDEAEPIRQKLHATLGRIRRAAGANVIRYEDNLYSINPELDLWCDVFEFETAVSRAQLSSPQLAQTEVLWRRAVELYKGPFLQAFTQDWVIDYRQALEIKYLNALLALGQSLRLRGAIQDAVECFRRATTVDSYREDIHRELMLCYAMVGRRDLILRQMERLSELLREELDIRPAVETYALVENLLNQPEGVS